MFGRCGSGRGGPAITVTFTTDLQTYLRMQLTSTSPTAIRFPPGYGCNTATPTPATFSPAAIPGAFCKSRCRFRSGPTLVVTQGQTVHGDADQRFLPDLSGQTFYPVFPAFNVTASGVARTEAATNEAVPGHGDVTLTRHLARNARSYYQRTQLSTYMFGDWLYVSIIVLPSTFSYTFHVAVFRPFPPSGGTWLTASLTSGCRTLLCCVGAAYKTSSLQTCYNHLSYLVPFFLPIIDITPPRGTSQRFVTLI